METMQTSLDDVGREIAATINRADGSLVSARLDYIAAGKALLSAEPRVFALAANRPRNEQNIRWNAWLLDHNISLATARKCMKLASAPDPEQALADLKAEGREKAQKAEALRAKADENRDLAPGAARLLAALIECLNMEDADEALAWALAAARRVMNKAA